MQTLGLADSIPRTESRWRALFWPTIRNEVDLDYVTRQGFWICCIVAAVTFVVNFFAGDVLTGAFESLFFFLAGIGVRERSRVAAITAFSTYLLSAIVLQKYTGSGFGIVRIIFLALLLANIRGNWLSARWEKDNLVGIAPIRQNETIGDKLPINFPPSFGRKRDSCSTCLPALRSSCCFSICSDHHKAPANAALRPYPTHLETCYRSQNHSGSYPRRIVARPRLGHHAPNACRGNTARAG
jgi:hypothetical protein